MPFLFDKSRKPIIGFCRASVLFSIILYIYLYIYIYMYRYYPGGQNVYIAPSDKYSPVGKYNSSRWYFRNTFLSFALLANQTPLYIRRRWMVECGYIGLFDSINLFISAAAYLRANRHQDRYITIELMMTKPNTWSIP